MRTLYQRLYPVAVFFSMMLAIGCDSKSDEDEDPTPVTTVLKSSALDSADLFLADDVSLTNVTGKADSIGLNFTEDNGCGFLIWGANSQTSRSGLEDRTYETFDMSDPENWSSVGSGMQGECDSAEISQVESYFVYLDLELDIGADSYVIRAYMAQQSPFEAGDILIEQDDVYYWYDTDADELVDEDSDRPDNVKQADLSKTIPWYDNDGADKIIMQELRMEIPSDETHTVTTDTSKVIVDVDFENSGLSVSDTTSASTILSTIELPFLEVDSSDGDDGLLEASLTLLTEVEKGTDEDPEPDKGN